MRRGEGRDLPDPGTPAPDIAERPHGTSARSDHLTVRSVRTAHGATAVWALTGNGPRTLVAVPGWVTHLTADWSSAQIGRLHRGLSHSFRLLRYDRPGTGMADRRGHDFSLRGEVDVLDRVLNAAGERQVVLLGAGLAGPVAVAFAARYPGRVAGLILVDTAATLAATADGDHGIPVATTEALAQLALADWGLGARIISEILLPRATPEQHRWFTDYQRGGAPPEAAAAMLRALPELDVRLLLAAVRAPTLVLHRRDESVFGVAAGEALAQGIARSHFAVLRGAEFQPWMGDIAALTRHVLSFAAPPVQDDLTAREHEVMQLVGRGLSNRAIGRWLGITETTVARHLANVYIKLDARGRIDALERLRALGVEIARPAQPAPADHGEWRRPRRAASPRPA